MQQYATVAAGGGEEVHCSDVFPPARGGGGERAAQHYSIKQRKAECRANVRLAASLPHPNMPRKAVIFHGYGVCNICTVRRSRGGRGWDGTILINQPEKRRSGQELLDAPGHACAGSKKATLVSGGPTYSVLPSLPASLGPQRLQRRHATAS